jgi:hypothetical protein
MESEQVRERAKRDAPYKEGARDGDGDGLVQDGTVHERPIDPPGRKPKAVPTSIAPGTEVSVSALLAAGRSRNSASAAALRRRLVELGYPEAGQDVPGSIGDGIGAALARFRDDNLPGSEGAGLAELVEALFAGTAVVTVA